MTHTPEFANWLLRHDPDYDRALSQADGHALAQYSDRIPKAPVRAQHLPITEAPWTHDDPECAANQCSAQFSMDVARFGPCFCKCHKAPELWIDQNHRNMVQANTAETLKRMSAVERDHYNMQPLTPRDMLLVRVIVVLGCAACGVLIAYAAMWIGGKL